MAGGTERCGEAQRRSAGQGGGAAPPASSWRGQVRAEPGSRGLEGRHSREPFCSLVRPWGLLHNGRAPCRPSGLWEPGQGRGQFGGQCFVLEESQLFMKEQEALRLLRGKHSSRAPTGKQEQSVAAPLSFPAGGTCGFLGCQSCSAALRGQGQAGCQCSMDGLTRPRAGRTSSRSQERGQEGSSGLRTQRPKSSHWLLGAEWTSLVQLEK